jgi:hypothetical protein
MNKASKNTHHTFLDSLLLKLRSFEEPLGNQKQRDRFPRKTALFTFAAVLFSYGLWRSAKKRSTVEKIERHAA